MKRLPDIMVTGVTSFADRRGRSGALEVRGEDLSDSRQPVWILLHNFPAEGSAAYEESSAADAPKPISREEMSGYANAARDLAENICDSLPEVVSDEDAEEVFSVFTEHLAALQAAKPGTNPSGACMLEGLEACDPESLFDAEWPEGLTGVRIDLDRGRFPQATLFGTREAVSRFLYAQWYYGGGMDADTLWDDLQRIVEVS